MQNTLKQSAMVIAVSLHLAGYSKSSSSSALGLAVELRFSPSLISPVPVAVPVAASDAPAAGTTVSTTPLFSSVTTACCTLGVAVFSESAILEGRRLLFVSLILEVRAGVNYIHKRCEENLYVCLSLTPRSKLFLLSKKAWIDQW
jgi:hypothetical protein